MTKAYEKKYVHFVDNEVVVWLLDFFRDHSATLIMVSVDPFHLNHIRHR